MSASPNNEHLHVIVKIRSGSSNANPLPPPPEGRELRRVWTLLSRSQLVKDGPVHRSSAFLEDRGHDWRIDADGALHYFSGQAPPNQDVEIVLDYETDEECQLRAQAQLRFDPSTGKPLLRATRP